LRAVSLNRTLNDASVEITKRKPLDLLPNPTAVSSSRGDWQNFKREVQPYAAVFLHGPQPHILRIRSIMAEVA